MFRFLLKMPYKIYVIWYLSASLGIASITIKPLEAPGEYLMSGLVDFAYLVSVLIVSVNSHSYPHFVTLRYYPPLVSSSVKSIVKLPRYVRQVKLPSYDNMYIFLPPLFWLPACLLYGLKLTG